MVAPEMDDIADRYAHRGVTSAFVYTREAHLGENYRHHTSMDLKRSHARALVAHANLRRRVLLDDLEGTAHRGYGLLPNMTYIVGRNLILYKAAWTQPSDVEHALLDVLDHLERRRDEKLRPFYSERIAWHPDRPDTFRAALERSGPQAVSDFYRRD